MSKTFYERIAKLEKLHNCEITIHGNKFLTTAYGTGRWKWASSEKEAIELCSKLASMKPLKPVRKEANLFAKKQPGQTRFCARYKLKKGGGRVCAKWGWGYR